MRNARLNEAQAGIKIVGRNINNLRYVDDTTLMAECEEENPPAMRKTWVRSLGWEGPLEKGKATHSSILAWRIPWTPWTAQSMGSQRVGRDFHFHMVILSFGLP